VFQKNCDPKYRRVESDDDVMKLTAKHTPIMIPWIQNLKPKF